MKTMTTTLETTTKKTNHYYYYYYFRVLAALAVVASLLVVLTQAARPAEAAFPGANGKIVFQSTRDGNGEIYIMNPDGTGQTNLTNDRADDSRPVLSPDGKKVVFVSDRGGNEDVYLMDTDPTTNDATNLTDSSSARDLEPAFSPDGKVDFTSNREGNAEI